MCTIVAAAVATGVASAAFGTMGAIASYEQQAAATAYSNAVAQQDYANQLSIAAANDANAGNVYEAELESVASAKSAYYSEISLNQSSANTAVVAELNKLQEKRNVASFDQQTALSNAIQAQGAVLASGKTGQSQYLRLLDTTRQLGFEQAQIDQTIADANRATGLAVEGILLDQTSADIAAWNGLPADPLAPAPSALPPEPIMQEGPSTLGLIAGIGSSVVDGASTGINTYATLKTS
tara:strand:- start:64 stop:777 length:714 start_codon:yes stop_codon:yes gene_type:complete